MQKWICCISFKNAKKKLAMKIIRQLLAALLLLFCVFACKQETKKSNEQHLTISEIRLEEDSKNSVAPPPAQANAQYQKMIVVPDEQMSIEIISLEGQKD